MKTLYPSFFNRNTSGGFIMSCLILFICLLGIPTDAQRLVNADMSNVRQELSMELKCVDISLINDEVACPEVYQPVCGCDGVTYANKCVAESRFGITEYKEGPCSCKLDMKIISRKLTCDGYAVCIAIDGEGPFRIMGNDGISAQANDNGVFCVEGLEGGQYFFTVTNSEGCVGTIGVAVPVVDYYIPGEVTDVSCYNGKDGAIEIKIEADADVKFEWTGPYGFTSNQQNISGLAAGVYTVKVSYADGSCYGIMGYTVKQPDELVLDIELNYPDCEGQPDGCAFVKGGTAPYKLFVFKGQLQNDIQPNITFTSDAEPKVEGLDRDELTKFDASPNDLTKYCAKNIADGFYLVLVVDANGCYVWKRVKVEAGKPLEVEVKTKAAGCHGDDDGAICYIVTGGKAPYKAVIIPATPIIPVEGDKGCFEGLFAGEYKLIITDANGCEFSTVVQIEQADELLADFEFTSDICDENASGCLRVKGGTKPYHIFVFTCPTPIDVLPKPVLTADGQVVVEGMERTDKLPYNEIATDEYERCVDNIPAGIYYVVIVDKAGCYTYVKIEVPDGGGLVVDGEVKHVSCYGGKDGAIKIEIKGGQAPYTVVWHDENGNTFDNAENLSAGKYKVEVKDANGCTGAARFEIKQPEKLAIDFKLTSDDCSATVDGCLKVSGGTPGYKIWVFTCPTPVPVLEEDVEPVFEDGVAPTIKDMVRTDEVIFYPNTDDGFIACAQDIPADIYYVLVIDHNGCWKVKRIKIEPANPITIDFRITSEACAGQVDGCLKVSGGKPDYKIWVFTCPAPVPTDVEPVPVFNANEVPAIDGMVRNDDISFAPDGTDGFVRCAKDIPAGIYYILVVDQNKCWKIKRIKIEPAAGGLEILSEIKHVTCHGGADGAIDIKVPNATAPVTYSWSNGATTEDIDGLTAGEYTVKVEDANGCTARKTFIVRQPSAIEIDFRITSEGCSDQVDGCLKVSGGSPGYKVWAYKCPVPLPVIPDPVFTTTDAPKIEGMELTDAVAFELSPNDDYVRCAKDIPAGVYYILVVDSKGCWKLEKIEVPAPSGIRIEGEVKCSNGDDGAIDIKVSGGGTIYYFSWSNGATTEDISGLAPGTYEVKVYTENDFCTGTATFVVRECCDLILNCKYDFFGEYACVDPEGGTPEYQVVYTNLGTGEIINNSDDPNCVFDLAPGTYYVKVTDQNGCMADEIFIIEEAPCKAGEALVDPKEISSGESTVFTLINYSGVSIQWQFMTEDTDWIDVPGGTTEVFITPPIHVGKDKRIKVRAAVTCENGEVLYSTQTVFYVLVHNTTNRAVGNNPVVKDAELFDSKIPIAKELDVKVFPTVSRGDFNLQFENDHESATRIHVVDLNGQVKQTLNAGQPAKGETQAIDMKGYVPGMYLITVESEGNRMTKRVFVGN